MNPPGKSDLGFTQDSSLMSEAAISSGCVKNVKQIIDMFMMFDINIGIRYRL